MGPRLPARSGEEFDAITGWRHALAYFRRPGVTSSIKRGMRHRERVAGRKVVEAGLSAAAEEAEERGWDDYEDYWGDDLELDEAITLAMNERGDLTGPALHVPLGEVLR